VAHRLPALEQPAVPAAAAGDRQALLLFRSGPAELLALPLSAVRRVVMIERNRIERLGERELIRVDGAAVNVLRLDRLLDLTACPDQDPLFLILPRHGGAAVGLLASEIVDTPTLHVRLDTQAYRADGVLGSMSIRDRIAVFLDLDRLLEFWSQATSPARPALPAPPGGRILVVEDTQFFRQLIRNHLESAGHEVVVAGNGREGLERLKEGPFDLVVSDIEMPVMDGLAFAREVRADARFGALPLLALTTLSGEEDRARAVASGFNGYEIKLDRPSFLARVGELLQRGRQSAGLPGACEP
jgi:two-component system chemotaxis sensor kinase CheA